jgi:hypothetical protein
MELDQSFQENGVISRQRVELVLSQLPGTTEEE